MTILALHNTLTGRKETFVPADLAHVRVYACGPTVYNYAHIGNGRMAVVFDQLVRVLRQLYPCVTYVSNITDVDDKIMDAARQTGENIDTITRRYEAIYNEDMAALGVVKPDIQPRATEHIGEMIAQIEQLIARKHAYAAQGHVLFHVPSFPAYGGLSGRSRDDQIAGARVEVSPFKKDPADFVLWKPSAPDQPGWASPWGRGRPGWHIECSAMAEKHLGLPFDIHGGGADLKFPHHENEIAQSCCAHGREDDLAAFARYWVHNGFVTVEGEKMSKSIGNIRLVHDLIAHYPGEVLRLTLLSAHYRAPLSFTSDALNQARSTLDRYYRILFDLKDVEAVAGDVPPAVMAALCDDLNTPQAIAELNALARDVASADAVQRRHIKSALLAAGNFLGLLQADPTQWLGYGVQDGVDGAVVERLLQERQQARQSKDFSRADEIRRELSAMGIEIEDTPQGTKWRKAS
ncbi:MAG: cysteine--tRNA ligase [Micavibrio aeruginosavorus]|uniref:Cysteine--tRNA ligase n=1 Tax=Micavibrio aeruginosavorus TaxID=349221 RepID=A0A7T5R2F3_9BACT|nr:MAG: cysteine--tRNA ligase [Micavibrio aeruginosavorus]